MKNGIARRALQDQRSRASRRAGRRDRRSMSSRGRSGGQRVERDALWPARLMSVASREVLDEKAAQRRDGRRRVGRDVGRRGVAPVQVLDHDDERDDARAALERLAQQGRRSAAACRRDPASERTSYPSSSRSRVVPASPDARSSFAAMAARAVGFVVGRLDRQHPPEQLGDQRIRRRLFVGVRARAKARGPFGRPDSSSAIRRVFPTPASPWTWTTCPRPATASR